MSKLFKIIMLYFTKYLLRKCPINMKSKQTNLQNLLSNIFVIDQ